MNDKEQKFDPINWSIIAMKPSNLITPEELEVMRAHRKGRSREFLEWVDDPDFAVVIHTETVRGRKAAIALGHSTLKDLRDGPQGGCP